MTTNAPASQHESALAYIALSRGLDCLANWREVDDMIEYYDDATNAWYRCDVADVIALGSSSGPDAYSHWCAQTSHEQVAA
jgi:hypothetical protein